jgi:hypothetical protein
VDIFCHNMNVKGILIFSHSVKQIWNCCLQLHFTTIYFFKLIFACDVSQCKFLAKPHVTKCGPYFFL